MSGARWVRVIALLAAGTLLATLVAPAVAFAVVGEPVEGAEVFLSKQPGDDPIVVTTTDGGKDVGEFVSISWPAGAVLGSTDITITPGESPTGVLATDGGRIHRIAKCVPDGLVFQSPVTLTLTAPSGQSNLRMYLLNTGTGQFEPVAGTRSGDKVSSSIGHFSIYGIGGDEPPAPVPADSTWSLAALALAGIGLGVFALHRTRHAAMGG